MLQQVLAVTAVLAALASTLWWLRRKGLPGYAPRLRRPRRLRTAERLVLAPQHSLCLVRLADRGLLIGVSPAGCALLESFPWASLECRAGAAEDH